MILTLFPFGENCVIILFSWTRSYMYIYWVSDDVSTWKWERPKRILHLLLIQNNPLSDQYQFYSQNRNCVSAILPNRQLHIFIFLLNDDEMRLIFNKSWQVESNCIYRLHSFEQNKHLFQCKEGEYILHQMWDQL